MLFLPKGLPQSHQQESTVVKNPRLLRHAHTVYVPQIDTEALCLIGTVAFILIPGDNPIITFLSGTVAKGISVYLKPMIHIYKS